MFFSQSKFLYVFLNNSKLHLAVYSRGNLSPKLGNSEILDFEESVVKDSAVVDSQAFQLKVIEFLNSKKEWEKIPIIFVIPEEKVFLKGFELELGDLEKKDKFRKEFINEIPFLEEELIVKERLNGKVLEFAAVSKVFVSDLKKPFLDAKRRILGMISIPQAIVGELGIKERVQLITFYDNDMVMAVAENSSILFSETERLIQKDAGKQMFSAFKHFSQHPHGKDLKKVILVLDPDLPETVLKEKLEAEGYEVIVPEKSATLDLLSKFYDKSGKEIKKLDFLSGLDEKINFFSKYKKYILYTSIVLGFAVLIGGGILAYNKFISPRILQDEPVLKEQESAMIKEEPPKEVPVPESSAKEILKPIVKKEDYPISIFNGTMVAGEAGRLKTSLVKEGYLVLKVGNYENKQQIVTTIFVNADVPEEIISDLRTILLNYYQEVLTSPSPVKNGAVDIVIGKKK